MIVYIDVCNLGGYICHVSKFVSGYGNPPHNSEP